MGDFIDDMHDMQRDYSEQLRENEKLRRELTLVSDRRARDIAENEAMIEALGFSPRTSVPFSLVIERARGIGKEIATKDAEIARLKAENERLVESHADLYDASIRECEKHDADLARVRGQRDRLALGYAATPSALKSVGLRIVGGTVEEIES